MNLPHILRMIRYLSYSICHSGNIGSIYWQGADRVPRSYGFSYDGLGHIRYPQGNVRQVTDSDGNVEQDSHYYPYGMLMGESSDILATARAGRNPLTDNRNPYLYGGKEYLTTAGANLLDFTARTYDPSTLLFHTPDPLRDKYLHVNSYLYCSTDPVNRIDPTGCGDFWDGGKKLGNDGKSDGKIYVMKTDQQFKDGGTSVPGSGLSGKEIKAAKNFIRDNSGKSEKFSDGCIAYTHSIEIEGSLDVRKGMVSAVCTDNGKGGRSDNNNREHGGYIKDGKARSVDSGPVCDLETDSYAYIIVPDNNCPTFHSHPSGEINVVIESSGGIKSGNRYEVSTKPKTYVQFPSPQDIENSGNTTNYVFGKRNGNVYIYNSSGIQAVVKVNEFLRY